MRDIKKSRDKIDATRRHLKKDDDGKKRPGMYNADWVSYNKASEMKHTSFPTRPPKTEKSKDE